ncbi:hypothetical protein EVAR_53745_1 [Eumeta japonica]|uniref:Uncharacterized protein n=1 Tax=Eumeta variegata TaxID=151549 RepID=A0A4C1Z9Q7_EUMVA|nr:hypothetical protein EVAR_53745_1 [Eumeta japonica]
MDSWLYDLKEYECELRMDELSVKRLLYTDAQVNLAPSAWGLQKMVNKMNNPVKKRGMKVNGVKIRSLRSTCGVSRKDRCRKSDVREWRGFKEDLVTRVERALGILIGWIGAISSRDVRSLLDDETSYVFVARKTDRYASETFCTDDVSNVASAFPVMKTVFH